MTRSLKQLLFTLIFTFSILTPALIYADIPEEEISSETASSQDEVRNAITNYANSLGGVHDYVHTNGWTSYTCAAFADFVWDNVFGFNMGSDNFSISRGSDPNSFASFITSHNPKAGDRIWIHGPNLGNGNYGNHTHHMVIMNYDNNGIWVTEGSDQFVGSGKCKIIGINKYYSYGDLISRYYSSGGGYTLYSIYNNFYNVKGSGNIPEDEWIIIHVPDDTTPPQIKDVQTTILSPDKYRVECTVTDNVRVSKVQFPTWTEANGQDDIIWYTPNGDTHFSCTIERSNHKNEYGTYNTHIYAWDPQGNKAFVPLPQFYLENQPPVISNVQITDITKDGYTVSCKVTDNKSIKTVQFPTWTEKNGQDDLIWHNAVKNGNTYSCRIKSSAHNNEADQFITHVYAWDECGNKGFAIAGTTNLITDTTDPSIVWTETFRDTSTKEVYVVATVIEENLKGVDIEADRLNENSDWIYVRPIKNGTTYNAIKLIDNIDTIPPFLKSCLRNMNEYGGIPIMSGITSDNPLAPPSIPEFDASQFPHLWYRKFKYIDTVEKDSLTLDKYIFRIFADDTSGNTGSAKLDYISDWENPTVTDLTIEDISEDGFVMLCMADDNRKIESVNFIAKPANASTPTLNSEGYKFTDLSDDPLYQQAYEEMVAAGYDPDKLWVAYINTSETDETSFWFNAIANDGINLGNMSSTEAIDLSPYIESSYVIEDEYVPAKPEQQKPNEEEKQDSSKKDSVNVTTTTIPKKTTVSVETKEETESSHETSTILEGKITKLKKDKVTIKFMNNTDQTIKIKASDSKFKKKTTVSVKPKKSKTVTLKLKSKKYKKSKLKLKMQCTYDKKKYTFRVTSSKFNLVDLMIK